MKEFLEDFATFFLAILLILFAFGGFIFAVEIVRVSSYWQLLPWAAVYSLVLTGIIHIIKRLNR